MPTGITRAGDRVAIWLEAADDDPWAIHEPPSGAESGPAGQPAAAPAPEIIIPKSNKFKNPANNLKKLLNTIDTNTDDKSFYGEHAHPKVQDWFDTHQGFHSYVKPQYADALKATLGAENYDKLLYHMPTEHHQNLTTQSQAAAPKSNKFTNPANALKKLLADPHTETTHVQQWMASNPGFKPYLQPQYADALKKQLGPQHYQELQTHLTAPQKAEEAKKPGQGGEYTGPGSKGWAENIQPTGPHHNQYTDPSQLKENQPGQEQPAEPAAHQQNLDAIVKGQGMHTIPDQHWTPEFKKWLSTMAPDKAEQLANTPPQQALQDFHNWIGDELAAPTPQQAQAQEPPAAAPNADLTAGIKKIFPQAHPDLDNMSQDQVKKTMEGWLNLLPENPAFAEHVPQLQALYDQHFGKTAQPGQPDFTDPGFVDWLKSEYHTTPEGLGSEAGPNYWQEYQQSKAAKPPAQPSPEEQAFQAWYGQTQGLTEDQAKQEWAKMGPQGIANWSPGGTYYEQYGPGAGAKQAPEEGGGWNPAELYKDLSAIAEPQWGHGAWNPHQWFGDLHDPDIDPEAVKQDLQKQIDAIAPGTGNSHPDHHAKLQAIYDKHFGQGAAQPTAPPALDVNALNEDLKKIYDQGIVEFDPNDPPENIKAELEGGNWLGDKGDNPEKLQQLKAVYDKYFPQGERDPIAEMAADYKKFVPDSVHDFSQPQTQEKVKNYMTQLVNGDVKDPDFSTPEQLSAAKDWLAKHFGVEAGPTPAEGVESGVDPNKPPLAWLQQHFPEAFQNWGQLTLDSWYEGHKSKGINDMPSALAAWVKDHYGDKAAYAGPPAEGPPPEAAGAGLSPTLMKKYYPGMSSEGIDNWLSGGSVEQQKAKLQEHIQSLQDKNLSTGANKWTKIYQEAFGEEPPKPVTQPALDKSKTPTAEELAALGVSAYAASSLSQQTPDKFWANYQKVKDENLTGNNVWWPVVEAIEAHGGVGIQQPPAPSAAGEPIVPGQTMPTQQQLIDMGISPPNAEALLDQGPKSFWGNIEHVQKEYGPDDSSGVWHLWSPIINWAKGAQAQPQAPKPQPAAPPPNPEFDWDQFAPEFQAVFPKSDWGKGSGPGDQDPAAKIQSALQTSLGNAEWAKSPKTQQIKDLFNKWFPQQYAAFMSGQGKPAASAPTPAAAQPTPEEVEPPEVEEANIPPPEPSKPFKSEKLNPADLKQWAENKPTSAAGWKNFSTWWGNTQLTPEQETGLFKSWFGKDASPEQANAWFAAMFEHHSEPSEGDLGVEGMPGWATAGWAFGNKAKKEWPVFAAWAAKEPGLPKNLGIKQKLQVWNGLSAKQKAEIAADYFPSQQIDAKGVIDKLKAAYPDSDWSAWSKMSPGQLAKNVQNLAESGYKGAIPIFNETFGGNVAMPAEEETTEPTATQPSSQILPESALPSWATPAKLGKNPAKVFTEFAHWAQSVGQGKQLQGDQYPSDLYYTFNNLPQAVKNQVMAMDHPPWHDMEGFEKWKNSQPKLGDTLKTMYPAENPINTDFNQTWWNNSSYTGYQKKQLQDLIKEEPDPQKKLQLGALYNQGYSDWSTPTLAESLKAIGPPPAYLKTKDWDTWLQTHSADDAAKMLKKQIKAEPDPDKWVQYIDALYKHFNTPSGSKVVTNTIGKYTSGQGVGAANLKQLHHWKTQKGADPSQSPDYYGNLSDYDPGSYVTDKEAKSGNWAPSEKHPQYFGWTPPGKAGTSYTLDPALMADTGKRTYPIPAEEKGSKSYQALMNRADEMAKSFLSPADRKTLKSDSFANWFNKAPKDYQQAMADHPGGALDDFAAFMAGGPTYSKVPEGEGGKEKWYDVSPFANIPKAHQKNFPPELTHQPQRAQDIKFPRVPDVQETLPLAPGEHFAPQYAPMPVYRIVKLPFTQEPKMPNEVSKLPPAQQQAFMDRQRARLRRIDEILNGTPAGRNVEKDKKTFDSWVKSQNLSARQRQELADELFSTQPMLGEDERWKHFEDFSSKLKGQGHNIDPKDIAELAEKLGVTSPNAKGTYDHPELGHLLLDYIEAEGYGGMGIHWTRDIDKLYKGIPTAGIDSSDMVGRKDYTPVLISGLWAGQGESGGSGGAYDPHAKSELEQNLRGGAPVHVRRVQIRSPDKDWHDTMDPGPMSEWQLGRDETASGHKVHDKPSLAEDLDGDLGGGKHDPEYWDRLKPGTQAEHVFAQLIHDNPKQKDKLLKTYRRHFVGRPDLTLKPHTRKASLQHMHLHPVRVMIAAPQDLYGLAMLWGIPHPERYGMPYQGALPAPLTRKERLKEFAEDLKGRGWQVTQIVKQHGFGQGDPRYDCDEDGGCELKHVATTVRQRTGVLRQSDQYAIYQE